MALEELVEWEGGREGKGKGVPRFKNTLNFRLRCSVCGDQMSVFVRQVACWRWDDAVHSHTLMSWTMTERREEKRKCGSTV